MIYSQRSISLPQGPSIQTGTDPAGYFPLILCLYFILEVQKNKGIVFEILRIRIPTPIVQCYFYLPDRTKLNT